MLLSGARAYPSPPFPLAFMRLLFCTCSVFSHSLLPFNRAKQSEKRKCAGRPELASLPFCAVCACYEGKRARKVHHTYAMHTL